VTATWNPSTVCDQTLQPSIFSKDFRQNLVTFAPKEFPSSMVAALLCSATLASDFPEPGNNQNTRDSPLTNPTTLIEMMTLPEGFKATVFASEPDVRNPIAMCWDERGRMWVAENYTYSDAKERFDLKLRDRILILEDTDQDGRFDKRSVFADDLQLLTSIERGFGGVYALCPPHLYFIPCAGDKPAGPPQIVLEGFDSDKGLRHTIANGLKWGPAGWLYGRTGITRTSFVGPPGTPKEDRQPTAGGMWRYHPLLKRFEPYCHGTTNPWGSDWNEDGELFFINTVIGHLWHGIPGAHFKRMFGEDPYPHIYELIDQHADHYHWDTGQNWQKSRNAAGLADSLGGGHAHVGMTIYQGDQFPPSYRGKVFTANLHGRRLNVERLERHRSGYLGKHEPDFMSTRDPWFRAVEVSTGPNGSLFVLDWSDIGECHEHDGVHRTSGRIYRISYGDPVATDVNVSQLSNDELVSAQSSSNEWRARMARWELRERVHRNDDIVQQSLAERIDETLPASPEIQTEDGALRRLWLTTTLSSDASGALALMPWFQKKTPVLHAQLIKTLTSFTGPEVRRSNGEWVPRVWSALTDPQLVASAPSTRLALASALPTLPPAQRADLASILLSFEEDASDHNLPLLIWSGIRELPSSALANLFADCRQPKARRFITRRLAEDINRTPAALEALLDYDTSDGTLERLQGMSDAFQGWKSAPMPSNWSKFSSAIPNDDTQQSMAIRLTLLFGDTRHLQSFIETIENPEADPAARRSALETLIDLQVPDLAGYCTDSLAVPELAATAIGGLATIKDPAVAQTLVDRYEKFPPEAQQATLTLLASRPASANVLLDQLGESIPKTDLTPLLARQIQNLGKPAIQKKLSERWGKLRDSPEELKQSMQAFHAKLTPEFLAEGDPSRGKSLFQQHCGACHKLYGEGGSVGPDITGSGRHQIDYLLESIVDPSAVVSSDHALVLFHLKDGRVLSGMIQQQTPETLTFSMNGQTSTLRKDQIRKQEKQSASMMPPGLLDPLNDTELKDLFSYLMSKQPPPLPE